MGKNLRQKKAEEALMGSKLEAEAMLKDADKTEEFLQKIEEKVKSIPKAGEKLAYVPALISLVRSYIKKEYTEISKMSVVLIVSALMYLLSPIDIIPDGIPGAGYIDDALVIDICIAYIEKELDQYNTWRKENK